MKYSFTIYLLIVSSISFAQKKYKLANNLFDNMQYIQAAKAYEATIDLNTPPKEVLQKIGDSYYFNTNMEQALKWYDVLLSEYPGQVDSTYVFRCIHALKGTGNYKVAEKLKTIFSKGNKNPDLSKKNKDTTTVRGILERAPQFTMKNLSINTKFSDFGPMFYGNKLMYSSAADSTGKNQKKYHWNEQPYLNFHIGRISVIQEDVTKVGEFPKELNTKYHEATLSFSPDYQKVYFTRNNYKNKLGKDANGVSHLKLYSANLTKRKNGSVEWSNIRELPFNSDKYSVGHPAVSPDGEKLYFVSDMPGTIGETDIFMVKILANGVYSKPQNLGPKINTPRREMFPFATASALYFASDGHLGLGGLDVFQSDVKGVSFNNPVNLGAPLNSNLDDFGYIVNEKTDKGYVCSNRKSGKGDDDIYAFTRFEVTCIQKIDGYIVDQKTKIPIENAMVEILDDTGIKARTKSGKDGSYTFEGKDFSCNTPYIIDVTKKGYKQGEKEIITTKKNGEKNSVVVEIEKELNKLIINVDGILKINIDNIYFDLGKWYIRKDAASELNKVVGLMTEYPDMVIKIEAHTDSRGSDAYNLKLSKRRASSTKDYIISQGIAANRIESAIGYGETQLINNCENGVKCTQEEHDTNRRSEFIIIKM